MPGGNPVPTLADVLLPGLSLGWRRHLQAHRKREEKAREWLATSEGPVRWTGR